MTNYCQNKKEFLIHQLLLIGVFKKDNLHLFELSVDELEAEYEKLTNSWGKSISVGLELGKAHTFLIRHKLTEKGVMPKWSIQLSRVNI